MDRKRKLKETGRRFHLTGDGSSAASSMSKVNGFENGGFIPRSPCCRRMPILLAALCGLVTAVTGCTSVGQPAITYSRDRVFSLRGQTPELMTKASTWAQDRLKYKQDVRKIVDRAIQQYMDGKLVAARASLRSARRIDPYDVFTYEMEANIALDLGDRKGYIDSLQAVLAANPQSARIQNSVGKLLVEFPTVAGADPFTSSLLTPLHRAVELEPRNARYARDLAATYLSRGDSVRAAKVLTDAIQRNPIDESLALALARLHESTGDFKSAARYYDVTIKRDPENSRWWRQRAVCSYQIGDFQHAYDDYQHCIDDAEFDVSLVDLVEFGDACMWLGDFEQAQKTFDELIRRDEHRSKDLEVLRGICALQRGEEDRAKGIIHSALDHWPDDNDLTDVLALCSTFEIE